MSQPRLLGGRYELDQVIGRGGMAEVYRARDLRLDRMVAVKTLRHDLARDHTFQARFRREAQSAASLNHPSIIAVYDTGEDVVDGLSIPYIIMEYVDGRTLKELLDDDRRLLPERCAEVTDGILRALEYSHQNGIVHRDIKPANVMLTRQAEVKVMDFGIARAMNDNQATMTQTSQVIGTAQYLSPEQARGERVDARSDIYSTGCVLYELLTGRPPFTGDSPVSIAYQHVREQPVPPTQVDPEIPTWLEDITLRAMTKDREERYQSAEEMRQDIQRGLQGLPTEARTMAMAAGSTTALPPVEDRRDRYDDDRYDDYDDRDEGVGRRNALWIVLAVLVVAALGFAVWLFNQPNADSIAIPDVEGMSQEEARAELTDAGFEADAIETREQNHDEIPEGDVIGTDPPAGEERSPTSTITLLVSTGPGSQEVPDVSGQDRDTAAQTLDDAGFEVGDTTEEPSDSVPEGQVIRTDPRAGTNADPGSQVNLVLSSGPEPTVVPDLSGMSREEAEGALGDLGLSASFSSEPSDAEPNTVIRQDPGANAEVEPGTTVNVVLAEEQEEPSTPPPDQSSPPPGQSSPPPGWPTDFPWPPGE
ncbi:Stk1 family PASTA domain-containing Ser/Thr kinase [Streptomonospora nanhaiensis]|uniref:non-specific serine/threonine protein kinase n=1 Tax=Streptomonospora nanhaiensis TaxID=1323731 RepID=A0A853BQQ7_9ACTN|nr:Stk1 family PASTA domain-containing Ser/Thr kinase [Streptomonospora nanhaiensis]MBV2364290.1 Stk1 family PASTA domain-containing Ser/Thr kinase [Streptomonospora nanhaiensis]MBX9390397.1 Stk1 family PASTA domain-containing Ser/Thr kinase [Streptomonospora nanhaiensis]NYI97174.1 serine/threonine-protein kinase [Streptomonospora nanhaiensis]